MLIHRLSTAGILPCIIICATLLAVAWMVMQPFRYEMSKASHIQAVYILDRWTGRPVFCRLEVAGEADVFLGCQITRYRKE